MDVLFDKFTLLAIAIVAVTAFFMYSVSVIRRNGALAYFARLFRQLKWIGATLAGFAGALVGLLAAGADTSEEDDDTREGDLTGVYNFRTHNYDNGTDPYGWYEDDL
jgi:hypothetical protein